MHSFRPTTAAVLLLIGLTPAGCGPSEAQIDAANAARVTEMDEQADRDLGETLAVLDAAEQAMQPHTPAPALTYNPFQGEAIDPDEDATESTEQTAVVETE